MKEKQKKKFLLITSPVVGPDPKLRPNLHIEKRKHEICMRKANGIHEKKNWVQNQSLWLNVLSLNQPSVNRVDILVAILLLKIR